MLALNSKLTAAAVQEFAGNTIYKRGLDYYRSGQVYEAVFDAESGRLKAGVYGNYGNYTVEISPAGRSALNADCDCPYDGYPCKHVVAVLLCFIDKRKELLADRKAAKQSKAQLEERLQHLSQPELAELITQLARQQPQVRMALLLRFFPEEEPTVLLFLRLVDEALRSAAREDCCTADHVRQLEQLIKQAEAAPPAVSIRVFWRIADRLLHALESWSMDSSLEGVAEDVLNKLLELHRQHRDLAGMKAEIEEKLRGYYDEGGRWLDDLLAEILGEMAERD
jgi:uncharacterized Zn finger protein